MTRQEVYDFIASMAVSQGVYGRLLDSLNDVSEEMRLYFLDSFADCKDMIGAVMQMEGEMDYLESVDTIKSALCQLTGEQVYILFTQYHGMHLLDASFYNYLVDEGILPEDDDDDDDDDDEGETR